MTIASADIHQAIHAVWSASDLDNLFHALWDDSADTNRWPVLEGEEASPKHPFPYSVVEIEAPKTQMRMSGNGDTQHHLRQIPVVFHIHANEVTNDTRSSKEIAAYLVEEVMKVFGGHPTEKPSGTISLSHGNHVITQYDSDQGLQTEQDRYHWILRYTLLVDVPVAV